VRSPHAGTDALPAAIVAPLGMTGGAKPWLMRTGMVIAILVAIAVVVGFIVMYLDLVQLGHDPALRNHVQGD
jgi:hypothetical protein